MRLVAIFSVFVGIVLLFFFWPGHISWSAQGPVRGAAVASVRDDPRSGIVSSTSLRQAQNLDMQVVYYYLGWDTLEVGRGVYDWAPLRDILRQVRAYDLKVVLRIYNPPAWRTADGAPPGALPTSYDDLREFMRALTTEVKTSQSDECDPVPDSVAGYVIWNEPNIKEQWGGSAPNAASYVAMLKAAYEGAKAGDPSAVIVSAPLAPTADKPGEAINDLTYLAQLYDNGLASYIDYVGMNGLGFQYAPDYDPGTADYCFTRLKYLHDVMVDKGDTNRKAWALEVGWLRDSEYDMGSFNAFKVSADQQSRYVERAFQKAAAEWPWLDLMAVWNLDFNRYYPPTSTFHWYSVRDLTEEVVGQIGGPVYAVAVQGNYAFVGIGPRLVVLDISDSMHPAFVGQTGVLPGSVSAVADGTNGGLRVVDVSDPASPSELGFYYTPGSAAAVAVSGSMAYVADAGSWDGSQYVGSGLRVVDVSNPASPTELGFYDTPGDAGAVAVVGSTAYVAGGLRVVDVSNPASPTQLGSYDTPGWAEGVVVSGSTAYVAGGGGLRVVDVSNPASPTEIGFYDTPGWARGVAVSGSTAYVADYDGLRVVDVADPATPVGRGIYVTPGNANGVAVAGNTAYVADGAGGLFILRITKRQITDGTYLPIILR
ncbi:MAG: hypothetical protein H8E35_12500 [Ardenticatenia bacterium]|nr:hypothetical protein [Ardenticatenia bacterium]